MIVYIYVYAEVQKLAGDLLSKWMAVFREGQSGNYNIIGCTDMHAQCNWAGLHVLLTEVIARSTLLNFVNLIMRSISQMVLIHFEVQ